MVKRENGERERRENGEEGEQREQYKQTLYPPPPLACRLTSPKIYQDQCVLFNSLTSVMIYKIFIFGLYFQFVRK